MTWTPEKVKQLTKLWNKGKSTVEIARELGISKNAVVGKVHRLDLTARPSPIIRSSSKNASLSQNPMTPKKATMSLLNLKINSCRWPFGDPGSDDFHFCGKDCKTGKSYCPAHYKIAYTSIQKLKLESLKNKKENKPAAKAEIPEMKNTQATEAQNADQLQKADGPALKELKSQDKSSSNETPLKAADKTKTPGSVLKDKPGKAENAAEKQKSAGLNKSSSKNIKPNPEKPASKTGLKRK